MTGGAATLTDDRKPTEVTDDFFVRFCRLKGKYPRSNRNSGKWLVFVDPSQVDFVWGGIKEAVEAGRLGDSAKCSTARPNPNAASSKYVICVYTYDWTDEADVRRVRSELRDLGITWKIPYKSDEDTLAGKYVVRGNQRISKYFE